MPFGLHPEDGNGPSFGRSLEQLHQADHFVPKKKKKSSGFTDLFLGETEDICTDHIRFTDPFLDETDHIRSSLITCLRDGGMIFHIS